MDSDSTWTWRCGPVVRRTMADWRQMYDRVDAFASDEDARPIARQIASALLPYVGPGLIDYALADQIVTALEAP